MSSYSTKPQKIQTSSNTYIPVSFEDKENVFEAINKSLNTSYRQDQGKVPKLELSRTRSFSRQQSPNSSFRTQSNESESNQTIFNYTNCLQQHLSTQGSVTRDYTKRQIPNPIPKPQTFQQAPSSRINYSVKDIVNGTQNNLYNYAYQPQRTRRSLSGSIYSSPVYDSIMNKQYPDQTLDYSQNFSSNGGNQILPPDSVLNDSRAAIAKETDDMVQEYRKKQKEIRRVMDDNRDFGREVESNLKTLQNLGQRKQDIMKDCINDLEELYQKYDKQGKYSENVYIIGNLTDESTQNYATQIKFEESNQDQSNLNSNNNNNNSQLAFSDFQERKSVEIEGDYSMSNYQTHEYSSENLPSIHQFDQ